MTDWRGTGELAWHEKPLPSTTKGLSERRGSYHCGSCGNIVSKLQYSRRGKCVECWSVDKRIIERSTKVAVVTPELTRREAIALHNTDISIQFGRYTGRWPN